MCREKRTGFRIALSELRLGKQVCPSSVWSHKNRAADHFSVHSFPVAFEIVPHPIKFSL